jgi:two-component system, cell cycle response regulator DivK
MARILIIEDNPANLELAQYLLEHRGHQVLVAGDGEVGVAVARRERPELILCDLQMPRLDGYGVLKQLRADDSLAGTPIVAVTAFSMSGDAQKVRDAGFNGYFSKPIEPETFVAQVEALLPDASKKG